MSQSRPLRSNRSGSASAEGESGRDESPDSSNKMNGTTNGTTEANKHSKRPTAADNESERYNFDAYLQNRIPETYSIWLLNDLPEEVEKSETSEKSRSNSVDQQTANGDEDSNEVEKEDKNKKIDSSQSQFQLFRPHGSISKTTSAEDNEKTMKTLKLPVNLVDFSDPTSLRDYQSKGQQANSKKVRAARKTVVTSVNLSNMQKQLKRKNDDRVKKMVDPLDDDVYAIYHKRREKEEKKMGNMDKISVLKEYDTAFDKLNMLGEKVRKKGIAAVEDKQITSSIEPSTRYYSLDEVPPGVLEALANVTRINNVNDDEEILIKLRLTITEMKQLMLNFERIRKLENNLKVEITTHLSQAKEEMRLQLEYLDTHNHINKHKRQQANGYDDEYDAKLTKKQQKKVTEKKLQFKEFIDTDEDEPQELALNLNKLKKRRLSKKISKYGSLIKVKFLDGITLVIDPVFPPKVSHDSKR